MKQHSLSRFPVPLCVLALSVGAMLTGCSGVVKNLNSAQVNTPSVAVANPFGLNGQSAAVTVNSSATTLNLRRPRIGGATNVFTFTNQNPISLATVQSAQLSFSVLPTVTLDGTTLPAHFTLSTFTIDGVISDQDGSGNGSTVALSQLTTNGPITFTQSAAGSSTYTADSGTIQLAQTQATTGQDLQTLINIVTGGPNANTATLTLSADSTNSAGVQTLPSGTVMHITFDTTTLTIKAS